MRLYQFKVKELFILDTNAEGFWGVSVQYISEHLEHFLQKSSHLRFTNTVTKNILKAPF